MTPSPQAAILSAVTRSGRIESRHRGSLVVVDRGVVRLALGDIDQGVYARSAVKPLQALPLLELGVADALALSLAELSLTSASHNGTPAHTAVAEQILARGGFSPEDLLCGPHSPMDPVASRALTAAGEKPRKIHNNCSGKHAGFLLLAQAMGVDKSRYLDPESASQLLVRQTVAEMAELETEAIKVGMDGCGAPTLFLPLLSLARGFANLTNPQGQSAVRTGACQTLLRAITAHPDVLAGEGRICTALIRALPGAIYTKNGAEGVYAFGLPGRGIGAAIKIDDGRQRGYFPVVIELLGALGVFPDGIPESLRMFQSVPVRNTLKVPVGEVRCELDLRDQLSS